MAGRVMLAVPVLFGGVLVAVGGYCYLRVPAGRWLEAETEINVTDPRPGEKRDVAI